MQTKRSMSAIATASGIVGTRSYQDENLAS